MAVVPVTYYLKALFVTLRVAVNRVQPESARLPGCAFGSGLSVNNIHTSRRTRRIFVLFSLIVNVLIERKFAALCRRGRKMGLFDDSAGSGGRLGYLYKYDRDTPS